MLVVATERDHVSPWPSVYKIQRLVRAPVSFVLTSGGHNVGIVNPPDGPLAHPKAVYRFASHQASRAPADPQEWLQEAPSFEGSWWPCWHAWLEQHSSARIPAQPVHGLREAGTPVMAPGTYVHQS
jgi:polyhydroxyalkanoate synthase